MIISWQKDQYMLTDHENLMFTYGGYSRNVYSLAYNTSNMVRIIIV